MDEQRIKRWMEETVAVALDHRRRLHKKGVLLTADGPEQYNEDLTLLRRQQMEMADDLMKRFPTTGEESRIICAMYVVRTMLNNIIPGSKQNVNAGNG